MGKRTRRRGRDDSAAASVETTDYTDADGNVLTLRNTVSRLTAVKFRNLSRPASATADDLWRRRTEFLFERFAVRWEIAGLPLDDQKELLGRYRLADSKLQRWVRQTLDEHVVAHQPELAESS